MPGPLLGQRALRNLRIKFFGHFLTFFENSKLPILSQIPNYRTPFAFLLSLP
jgi:hypothetical protein